MNSVGLKQEFSYRKSRTHSQKSTKEKLKVFKTEDCRSLHYAHSKIADVTAKASFLKWNISLTEKSLKKEQ